MTTPPRNRFFIPYRSPLLPILLVALGLLWLLTNLELIPVNRMVVLMRLWPLFLVFIGVDLLFTRSSARAGALLGAAAVALIVLLMLFGPRFGLADDVLVNSGEYIEPDDAQHLTVNLEHTIGPLAVAALDVSEDEAVFVARLNHVGEVEYSSNAEAARVIQLIQEDVELNDAVLHWLDRQTNLGWNVLLTPDIPLSLNITRRTGETNLDLRQLQLESLNVNAGLGALNISLPAALQTYSVNIEAGLGEIDIAIAQDAALNLEIHGGLGEVLVSLPQGASGVRAQIDASLDNIVLPQTLRRVDSGQNRNSFEGTWETTDYALAERHIMITYTGGSGGLVLQ
jgi:hypothetical protein